MTTPYELDLPTVVGDLNQTLANLIALRAEVSASPKPTYSVHGHTFQWVEFYKWLSAEIENVTRQINQAAPWEIISAAR